jgi:hypothetical protein
VLFDKLLADEESLKAQPRTCRLASLLMSIATCPDTLLFTTLTSSITRAGASASPIEFAAEAADAIVILCKSRYVTASAKKTKASAESKPEL